MDFKALYQNPKFYGSFSGQNRFIQSLKKQGISTKGVRKSLRKINSYTLHKPVRKPPKYRRVFTKRIGYLYQIDLVDMQSMVNYNNGYKWLITVIDTFSKKAWVFKTKSKHGPVITSTMQPFLQQNTPEKMEFDQVVLNNYI